MKPSDTHIDRMAETFAERTPFLRPTRSEAVEAWREALELGREKGILEEIEANMRRKKVVDLIAEDAWGRAKEY